MLWVRCLCLKLPYFRPSAANVTAPDEFPSPCRRTNPDAEARRSLVGCKLDVELLPEACAGSAKLLISPVATDTDGSPEVVECAADACQHEVGGEEGDEGAEGSSMEIESSDEARREMLNASTDDCEEDDGGITPSNCMNCNLDLYSCCYFYRDVFSPRVA